MSFRNDVLRAARAAGWKVREGKKHTLLYPLDGGRPYPISRGGKPHEQGHERANCEHELRRRGLSI